MTLTVGSLFSGIGGLELGLERAGMKVIWNSEIDPYASAVLNKHWPDVPNLGDVTTIDWTTVRPRSGGDDLATAVARVPPGPLSPMWVEWLMGYPLGWTVLSASEMPSSRKSPRRSAAGS